MFVRLCCFLCYGELSTIRRSSINFHETHTCMSIFIERSETDVHKEGNTVVITRSVESTCPVSMLERYFT